MEWDKVKTFLFQQPSARGRAEAASGARVELMQDPTTAQGLALLAAPGEQDHGPSGNPAEGFAGGRARSRGERGPHSRDEAQSPASALKGNRLPARQLLARLQHMRRAKPEQQKQQQPLRPGCRDSGNGEQQQGQQQHRAWGGGMRPLLIIIEGCKAAASELDSGVEPLPGVVRSGRQAGKEQVQVHSRRQAEKERVQGHSGQQAERSEVQEQGAGPASQYGVQTLEAVQNIGIEKRRDWAWVHPWTTARS